MAERRVRNAEVRSSTLLCSTKDFNDLRQARQLAVFLFQTFDRRLTRRTRFGQFFDRCPHRLVHRVRVTFGRPDVTVAEYLSNHNDVDPGVCEPRRRRVAQVVKAKAGNPRRRARLTQPKLI